MADPMRVVEPNPSEVLFGADDAFSGSVGELPERQDSYLRLDRTVLGKRMTKADASGARDEDHRSRESECRAAF